MEKDSFASISTEIYIIPVSSQYLVYAPLRRIAFLANTALVNFLWRLRQRRIEKYTNEEKTFMVFFKDIQLIGEEGDRPIATFKSAIFKPTEVTLFLTTRCNLRCVYCYASAGTRPCADMSLYTAKRGIGLVCGNAVELGKEKFVVGYHGGGEPTMHWKVLIESLAYARRQARKYGIEVRATAATNGVFSESKRRWIIENLDGVSLSVDGLPEIHDIHRPLSSGEPSSKIVFQTIASFEKANFSYGLRLTVTTYSVEKVPDSISYLLDYAHPKQIQLEPVYNLGRGQDKNLHVKPEAFVDAFRESKLITDKHGVKLFYSSARADVLTNRFCQSCGEGFSLTPDGDISACYEVCDKKMQFSEDFIFGRYDYHQKRFIFDDQKLYQLRNRTVENIPWCQECFCKWHCAGDCPNKARHAMIDGRFVGHPRCEITRALVLDQILEKINKSGGIFWVENSKQ